MRRVHDPEDIFATHEAKTGAGRLQVVNCLAHIPLGTEDKRRDTIVRILDVFRGADLEQACHHLGVGQAGVAQDCTARLKWFDDFVGGVAGECEARGRAVDFHRTPKSLLRTGCHAGQREG